MSPELGAAAFNASGAIPNANNAVTSQWVTDPRNPNSGPVGIRFLDKYGKPAVQVLQDGTKVPVGAINMRPFIDDDVAKLTKEMSGMAFQALGGKIDPNGSMMPLQGADRNGIYSRLQGVIGQVARENWNTGLDAGTLFNKSFQPILPLLKGSVDQNGNPKPVSDMDILMATARSSQLAKQGMTEQQYSALPNDKRAQFDAAVKSTVDNSSKDPNAGRGLTEDEKNNALIYGTVAGALDGAMNKINIDRIIAGGAKNGSIMSRLSGFGREALKAEARELPTELGQTALERMGSGKSANLFKRFPRLNHPAYQRQEGRSLVFLRLLTS